MKKYAKSDPVIHLTLLLELCPRFTSYTPKQQYIVTSHTMIPRRLAGCARLAGICPHNATIRSSSLSVEKQAVLVAKLFCSSYSSSSSGGGGGGGGDSRRTRVFGGRVNVRVEDGGKAHCFSSSSVGSSVREHCFCYFAEMNGRHFDLDW